MQNVRKMLKSVQFGSDIARGASVKSYRCADRFSMMWAECDDPSACSSAQMEKRSDFSERPRSIHSIPTAPSALRIWLHYQMQLLSWKQLRLGVCNAALKEIDARLIGKEYSFIELWTRSQILSETNQNISVNLLIIFTHLRVRYIWQKQQLHYRIISQQSTYSVFPKNVLY